MIPSSRVRTLRRVVGALIAVILLAPGGAAGAAVLDDVVYGVVPVEDPSRRDVAAYWTPAYGAVPSVTRAASSLRVLFPPQVRAVKGAGVLAVDGDAGSQLGYASTTEGIRMDGWDVVVDLPRVLSAIQAGNPVPPSELRLFVRTAGNAGAAAFSAIVVLRLTDGPAAAEVVVSLPQPSGDAWKDSRFYPGPLVLGAGGVTVVLEAVPGFWDDITSVTWRDWVGTEVQSEDLTADAEVSPDGDVLAVWIPETLPGGRVVSIAARSADGAKNVLTVRLWTPSSDPVAAYVQTVYADLFDREPDAHGLWGWTWELRRGAPYAAVADGITYSREFRTGLVTEAYLTYLGRVPDPVGLTSWVDAMQGGMHIQQMEAGFLASAEYHAVAGGTDEAWVRELYADVLGREAGAAEVAGWVPVVRSAGRMAVARGFVYSTEHLTEVVDGYYWWLLGRGIDPTGQQSWVSAIQAGHRSEAIIAGIIASPEYRGNVPVG